MSYYATMFFNGMNICEMSGIKSNKSKCHNYALCICSAFTSYLKSIKTNKNETQRKRLK